MRTRQLMLSLMKTSDEDEFLEERRSMRFNKGKRPILANFRKGRLTVSSPVEKLWVSHSTLHLPMPDGSITTHQPDLDVGTLETARLIV